MRSLLLKGQSLKTFIPGQDNISPNLFGILCFTLLLVKNDLMWLTIVGGLVLFDFKITIAGSKCGGTVT